MRTKEATMASTDFTRVLDDGGAEYELLPHAHTERAADEARALGLAPDEVAKTLVISAPTGHLRAVLPASERIDFGKVSELLGVGKKQVHLSSEADLARDYPEFELGAVPPLGGTGRDPVLVDRRVAERDSVVLEAGSHEQSVRVRTEDLIRLAEAQVVDISQD
jgi:Ala-tRNA(Pro) deacylase